MTVVGSVPASDIRHVAAVYILVWVVLLAYVVILNSKLGRLERQLDDVARILEGRSGDA